MELQIVERKIKDIIRQEIEDDLHIDTIGEPLANLGIDSIGLIKIIVEIEKEFCIEVQDEDLSADRFQSVKDFVKYVNEHL